MKVLTVAGQVLVCIAMIPFIPLIVIGFFAFLRYLKVADYL